MHLHKLEIADICPVLLTHNTEYNFSLGIIYLEFFGTAYLNEIIDAVLLFAFFFFSFFGP